MSGFDSVCIDGQVVSSINHYYPGPLEVMENRWIQWCVLLPREVDDPRYAHMAPPRRPRSRRWGPDGALHMEWDLQPNGRVAI